MYFQNVVPFVITVPMAMFYGYFSYTNTIEKSFRTLTDTELNSSEFNCTKPLRFREKGLDVITKLTQIKIPEAIQTEILEALDSLDWIELQPQTCGSDYKLNFDFVERAIDNKAELSWLLVFNAGSFLIMNYLVQNTIIGIIIKIVVNHVKQRILQLFRQILMIPEVVWKTASRLIMPHQQTYAAGDGLADDNDDIDDDDDVFVECSSISLQRIRSEEEVNEFKLEEKESSDESMGVSENESSTRQQRADYSEASFYTSTPVRHDSESRDFNSTEKLKQFLHQKYEDVDKLGISFSAEDMESFQERLGKRRSSRHGRCI